MKRRIRWYKHLYLSPSLEGMKRVVRYEIQYRKLPLGYYLLTLPSVEKNTFDIWPSAEIKMPWMKDTVLDVIGVASTKDEACKLAGSIIYDAFMETGQVDIRTYLGYK